MTCQSSWPTNGNQTWETTGACRALGTAPSSKNWDSTAEEQAGQHAEAMTQKAEAKWHMEAGAFKVDLRLSALVKARLSRPRRNGLRLGHERALERAIFPRNCQVAPHCGAAAHWRQPYGKCNKLGWLCSRKACCGSKSQQKYRDKFKVRSWPCMPPSGSTQMRQGDEHKFFPASERLYCSIKKPANLGKSIWLTPQKTSVPLPLSRDHSRSFGRKCDPFQPSGSQAEKALKTTASSI